MDNRVHYRVNYIQCSSLAVNRFFFSNFICFLLIVKPCNTRTLNLERSLPSSSPKSQRNFLTKHLLSVLQLNGKSKKPF